MLQDKYKMTTFQIIAWTVVLSVTVLFSISSDFKTFDAIMFAAKIVPLLLLYIINYAVIIPKFLFKKSFKGFLFWNVLLIALLLLAAFIVKDGFLFELIRPETLPKRPKHRSYFFLVYDAITHILMIGLVTAIRLADRLKQSEKALREAKNARVSAELMNLKNQMNPHFLLNTLNNIYSLTNIDVERAQKAIQELSRMLQYVLYDNNNEKVLLTKEVAFLKNYIELMKIRLSAKVRVDVQFHIDPNSQTKVAPLLFISLIENAFKHGVGPNTDSFIEIVFKDKTDENKVILSLRNSNFAKSDNDKSGHGIGLEQVKKRLELQYANAYQWDVKNNNNVYSSILTICTK